MKTIRYNTFETNSSSTHSLTILSDREYHNIEDCKAVIDENDNYLEFTEESVKSIIKDHIDNTKGRIDRYTKYIKEYNGLFDKDTGDWTLDQKRTVGGWQWERLSGSEIKIKLREFINSSQKSLDSSKMDLEYYQNIDNKKILELFLEAIPYISSLHNEDEDDLDDTFKFIKSKYSPKDFDFVTSFLRDCNNFETYGGDTYETFDESRTVDGVKIHCVGYYGYDG